MTDQDRIFRALSGVDDRFLQEVEAHPRPARPLRRWWIVAACLTLIVAMSVGVLAATQAGVRFKAFITDIWEDGTVEKGYDVEAQLGKVPLSHIQGDVLEVEGIIQAQIRSYQPYMSQLPQHWYRYYDTAAEALAYLGCDAVALPDWSAYETQSILSVMGNTQGQFETITLETDYERSGLRMQAFARLYTELYEGEITTGARDVGSDTFSETTYTAANGQECVVVFCNDDNGRFLSVDGYIVSGSVFYNLHVIYHEGEEETAEALLHEWLDSFPA